MLTAWDPVDGLLDRFGISYDDYDGYCHPTTETMDFKMN